MFLGGKRDFAWVSKDRLRHFDTGREECMPPKKHKKYLLSSTLAYADLLLVRLTMGLMCLLVVVLMLRCDQVHVGDESAEDGR